MKKIILIFFLALPMIMAAQQTLSLEECYALANTNYPLAKQNALLQQKSNLDTKVLNKGKMPKIDLNAQATYQSTEQRSIQSDFRHQSIAIQWRFDRR